MANTGSSGSEFVYRRVPSFVIPEGTWPEPAAFGRREHEPGISVYQTDRCSPRDLLQAYIDQQKALEESPDASRRDRATKNLDKHGRTPEELYDNGWRVARNPKSSFHQDDMEVGAPAKDGHITVRGSKAAFETYSIQIAAEAIILTREETLEVRAPGED